MSRYVSLGDFVNVGSDSVALGSGLWFCISPTFPGRNEAADVLSKARASGPSCSPPFHAFSGADLFLTPGLHLRIHCLAPPGRLSLFPCSYFAFVWTITDTLCLFWPRWHCLVNLSRFDNIFWPFLLHHSMLPDWFSETRNHFLFISNNTGFHLMESLTSNSAFSFFKKSCYFFRWEHL